MKDDEQPRSVITAPTAERGDNRRERALLIERASSELDRQLAQPLEPGLHLVATPIGNLGDITLRALAVLARADTIYCEDTRHSRTLMAHFGIRASLKPYHDHNAEQQRPYILAQLAAGGAVALISDAGTPLISDPGYKLAVATLNAGHRVFAIPGPSALLAGLSVAGLPTDQFLFAGFLPQRAGARQARIADLASVPMTIVVYEAPQRIAQSLHDLAQGLGPRPAALARELTKVHEEVLRGPLDELARGVTQTLARGEMVLIIGPPESSSASEAEIAAALAQAMEAASLRDASRLVAEALKVPKARVYEIGLKLRTKAP
jgi:16S rRNA (cytidine1402-2'-O)-methyltransferase